MKKIFSIVFFLFCFVAAHSSAGVREISLDGWWNFKTDPYLRGEDEKWYSDKNVFEGWEKMPVPGNWELRNEYAYYVGKSWYVREFVTPEFASADEDIFIRFEAVNINYDVWVNGKKAGSVIGGYFPMKFNVSGMLNPTGENNVVAVCVDNNFRTGAYWSWGGIRRHVDLIVENKDRIENLKITAIPDLNSGKAELNIFPKILINATSIGEIGLRYEIKKDNKVLIKGYSKDLEMPISLDMPKKYVKLWHFDNPEMYEVALSLVKDNKVVYEKNERFGIRKIEWKDNCFKLNGEPVRCLGMNWVADDRLTGNTLPAEVYKKHLDDMRRLGVTMTRLSHMPLPEEVLDYIDEIGMMIIDEIPVWGITPYASPESEVSFSWLKQMVDNHYNHPCVVGWSVGNEIGDQVRNPKVNAYVKKAVEFVNSMDSTRPAMDVSNSAQHTKKNDPSEHSNMLAFNCYSMNGYSKHTDNIYNYYGPKSVFMTEFGCQLITENLESNFDKETKALNMMRGKEYLFGASLWTYNDYRSLHRSPWPTWDNPVSENRAWGVVDAYGRRKLAYFQARKEYAPLKDMSASCENSVCNVTMTPRTTLDLPAYILRNYTLRLIIKDATGKVLFDKYDKLPDICPGDESLTRSFKLKKVTDITELRVVLSNPNGVELMEYVKYNSAPRKPMIKHVITAESAIRVYFDNQDDAKQYWVECIEKESGKKIFSDTLHFANIDIRKLKRDKEYTLKLYAANDCGVTASDVQECIVKGAGFLPPVVKNISPIDFNTGIGIGYSSEKPEYLFEFEYSLDKEFKNAKRVLTNTKGSGFIPGLETGKTYYVRIRSHYQYQQLSEWSPVYEVIL